MPFSFQKWVLVGFAIMCGALLCVGGAFTVMSVGTSIQESWRAATHKKARHQQLTEQATDDLAQITRTLKDYHQRAMRYPTEQEGLAGLCQCPPKTTKAKKFKSLCFDAAGLIVGLPQLHSLCSRDFKDPWGNTYGYRTMSDGTAVAFLTKTQQARIASGGH